MNKLFFQKMPLKKIDDLKAVLDSRLHYLFEPHPDPTHCAPEINPLQIMHSLIWQTVRHSPKFNPDDSFSEQLLAIGFVRNEVSEPLFTCAAVMDRQGAQGITLPMIVRHFTLWILGREPEECRVALGNSIPEGWMTDWFVHKDSLAYKSGCRQYRIGLAKGMLDSDTITEQVEKMLDPPAKGTVRLYHGTDIFAAEKILTEGIDSTHFSSDADFGAGFYVSESIFCGRHFALSHQGYGDPAIIVLDVYEKQYNMLPQVLNLDELERWQQLVGWCRRNFTGNCPDDLVNQYNQAAVVRGRIIANSANLSVAKSAPEPIQCNPPWTQVSFRADAGLEFIQPFGDHSGVAATQVVRLVEVPRRSNERKMDLKGSDE